MTTRSLAESDLDIFDDETLEDPYGSYSELRNTGSVVHLEKGDLFAVTRYGDVREVLRNWRSFTSARGAAFNDLKNERLRGTVLCSDPPEHEALRSPMLENLRLSMVRTHASLAETIANQIVGPLAERGSFDAVTDLAEPYVKSFVGELMGVSGAALDQFMIGSDAGFLSSGPMKFSSKGKFPDRRYDL